MLSEVNCHGKASKGNVTKENLLNHFHQNVIINFYFSLAKIENAKHHKFQTFSISSKNNGNVVFLNFIISNQAFCAPNVLGSICVDLLICQS